MLPVGLSAAELRGIARPLPKAQRVATAASDVELWYTPFETAGARGDKAFNRIDGPLLGIKRLPLPRPYQTMQPGPMHMGSLAAGDVNDDGWPDLAVGTSWGVFLYVNTGGGVAFQQTAFPSMCNFTASGAALARLCSPSSLTSSL